MDGSVRRTQLPGADFEDGGRQLLAAGRGKEMGFSLKSPERYTALLTTAFSPVRFPSDFVTREL